MRRGGRGVTGLGKEIGGGAKLGEETCVGRDDKSGCELARRGGVRTRCAWWFQRKKVL